MDFKDFLKQNKTKVRKNSDINSKRDSNNFIVIEKNDSWFNEHEWDTLYSDMVGVK